MKSDNKNHNSNFRRNLTVSVGLVLLAGFLLSVFYTSVASSRQAKAETLMTGQQLSKQSELLIRPLLLSSDRVSLNYLLNELNELEQVAGIEVVDAKGFVVARAGISSELTIKTRLLQQEKTIGSTTLWLDSSVSKQTLLRQLWPIGIISLFTAMIAILTLWLSCRQFELNAGSETETIQQEQVSFKEALAQQANDYSTETENHTTDIEDEEQYFERTTPSSSPENKNSPPHLDQQQEEQAEQEQPQDLLQTNALVDLLKPEASANPQMPKFEHHPEDLPEDEAQKPDEPPLVIEEEEIHDNSMAEQAAYPRSENPLLKSLNDREEVQLDLYSFEHELELILAPQDAIYLFYIDSHTASSENMHADEKATLLNVYHHLAKQVARIYNGDAELLDNKDILLRFELRDDGDSHGVNAVCAAMLFSLLYKGFNQSRIRGFQPVLSLQMSLARGHHDKHNLVQEEAHFLTRTTSSNELISHTALTEAPKLKEAMFEEADIRREDEDKVLLLKVTPKHQALLQKQANHLLTKIFSRN